MPRTGQVATLAGIGIDYYVRLERGKENRPSVAVLDALARTLREFESLYNGHRLHQALGQAAPLRPLPDPATEPGRLKHLEIRRRGRPGGTLHAYQHAA
ncbi:helix-turn-helix domain-containing protein [Streptomyces sp. NPDC001070]